jgi:hypothetical protein
MESPRILHMWLRFDLGAESMHVLAQDDHRAEACFLRDGLGFPQEDALAVQAALPNRDYRRLV